MRKEIKAETEARIASLQANHSTNIVNDEKYVKAEIERIEADAQKESDRIDRDEAANATYELYQSYLKAGFTEEQAWTLVQIVMSNATKRTLF